MQPRTSVPQFLFFQRAKAEKIGPAAEKEMAGQNKLHSRCDDCRNRLFAVEISQNVAAEILVLYDFRQLLLDVSPVNPHGLLFQIGPLE